MYVPTHLMVPLLEEMVTSTLLTPEDSTKARVRFQFIQNEVIRVQKDDLIAAYVSGMYTSMIIVGKNVKQLLVKCNVCTRNSLHIYSRMFLYLTVSLLNSS